jgi:alpha-ribazole phosphatase/probable phosphoglycerate mutase
MNIITIDLIRHGKPKGGKKYRGRIDDPLSNKGWQQMRSKLENQQPWDMLISSPLSRCREFAEELSAKINKPLIIEQNLQELAYGEWEGLDLENTESEGVRLRRKFHLDPIGNRPKNAELLTDFQARVILALESIIKKHEKKHVLIVAHAGVIRAIISYALNMPINSIFHIDVPYANLTRIEILRINGKKFPKLIFHNSEL